MRKACHGLSEFKREEEGFLVMGQNREPEISSHTRKHNTRQSGHCRSGGERMDYLLNDSGNTDLSYENRK